jgi:cellulose synthase/poly-beta-1,6-N-acetylglucosamine synthase-like glycosyltransferase
MILRIIFTVCVAGILYAYAGYPLFLLLVSRLRPSVPGDKGEADEPLPSVEMLIAAYNEEDVIGRKLENSLASDYPPELLTITVVSDGSTDRTDDIVRSCAAANVRLFRVEGRKGKTESRNRAAAASNADILIMTDSNSMFRPDAVRILAGRFRDPLTGAVCGQLKLADARGRENIYWRYEKWIKQLEDGLHSIIGANGSIFAVRRELYEPLPSGVDDDFVEPLICYRKGYKIVYEPEAVSEETDIPAADLGTEFRAKRRVVLRGLQSLGHVSGLLDPSRHGWLAFQLFSHKIMKWCVPFFMAGAFATSILLARDPFFAALLTAQSLFYAGAAAGLLFGLPALRIPAYFVLVNGSVFSAVISFLAGERSSTWEKERGGGD